MTNVGKWRAWWRNAERGTPIGFSPSYRRGADWLADCQVVEDWGCGPGHFATYRPDLTTVGVDGTEAAGCDVVADLAGYTSTCADGVFMRHVLEHDVRWRSIARNAAWSARRKLCIIIYTPMLDVGDEVIGHGTPIDVPILSLGWSDLAEAITDMGGWRLTLEEMESPATSYGVEWIMRGERVVAL